VARLSNVFALVLVQIPLVVQELSNSKDFRGHRWLQWRRYTRARQVKWSSWKIPGSALHPLLCFGNNVNRKCYHIWPFHFLFYFDSKIISGVSGLCFESDDWKWSTFRGKKVHSVTWLEDFLTSKWHGSFTELAFAPDDLPHDHSDLAALTSWRHHWPADLDLWPGDLLNDIIVTWTWYWLTMISFVKIHQMI